MRNKLGLFFLSMIFIGMIGISLGYEQKKSKVEMLLTNVEALANGVDNPDSDKKYRYQDRMSGECTIYVGGAYAKGTPIDCYSGDDHPVCSTCRL